MSHRSLKRTATGVCGALVAAAAVLSAVAVAESSAPTGGVAIKDNLYGTKFISAAEGWAVGAFGTIYHTRNGGGAWERQASHTVEQLFDVDFVDARHGWTVGRSGLILHTTDGGGSWLAQASGVDKHLFAVDFVDERFGCAVGDWGAILVTNDGGKRWESHTLPEDVILNDVAMLDRSRGWIAGEMGTLLVTGDGGRTWVERTSGVDKTLFGVYFADGRRGWAVGIDALILHTEDEGRSWEVRNGSTEVRALEQVGFGQVYENPSLYAISVIGNNGVAVGEIGAVFLSHDGGRTWKRRETARDSSLAWLRGLSMVPGTHGAIVGAGGQLLMIVDGQVGSPDEVGSAAEAVH